MTERKPFSLNDDDKMPFGKYKGLCLGFIPDDYWIWYLKQKWCDNNPRLVDYANNVLEDEED